MNQGRAISNGVPLYVRPTRPCRDCQDRGTCRWRSRDGSVCGRFMSTGGNGHTHRQPSNRMAIAIVGINYEGRQLR
jgi:hypothetical protein